MKLCYISILILLFSCNQSDIVDLEIRPTKTGNAVLEIEHEEDVFCSENIGSKPTKLQKELSTPGFYQVHLYFNGDKRKKKSFKVYLEPGKYVFHLDTSNQSYLKVESSSQTQNDLNEFHTRYDRHSVESQLAFGHAHPKSLVSAYLLEQQKSGIIEQPNIYKLLFNSFSPEVKRSSYGKNLEKQIHNAVKNAIGAPMPDLKGITPEGKPFEKETLRGKVTLIAFWASWNYPSVRDIPMLKSLYETNQAKGFEIVSIAIDKHENKWKKAIRHHNLNWLHVSDLKGAYSANFEQYNTNKLPFYVLLGPDLKVLENNLPLESVPIYLKESLPQQLNLN